MKSYLLQTPFRVKDDDFDSFVRNYRVITPIYGGSAEPGKPDKDHPVNGKGIRGQLRFWWRVMCGHQFADIASLRQAEVELWGGITGDPSPSKVVLDLSVPQGELRRRSRAVSFVNWPFSEELEYNYEFSLKARFPRALGSRATGAEVHASFWAWETFGGIGGRTRRGAGAICRLSQSGKPLGQLAEITTELKALLSKRWPDYVPHLDLNCICLLKNGKNNAFTTALDAWKALISFYHEFLKTEFNILKRAADPGLADERLPLGGPFRWKFYERSQRLASPVILRPLALGSDGEYYALIAFLRQYSPGSKPAFIQRSAVLKQLRSMLCEGNDPLAKLEVKP